MANIQAKDATGTNVFLKATGAGTDLDPFIKDLTVTEANSGTINTNIAAIAGAVSGSEFQVDVVTLPGTTQTDIGAIRTASELLDNIVSGSEAQVDIIASLPSGENHTGAVGGHTVGFSAISATYTRPANTTAYTAGDALSDSTTAPNDLEFTGCARLNGSSGYITGARLELSNTSFDGKIVLFLYRTTVTATNDNEALTIVANADFVGSVEFDSANLKANFGTSVGYIEGTLPSDRLLPFTCDAADTKLFGISGVETGFTPTSGGTFKFYLAVEQN